MMKTTYGQRLQLARKDAKLSQKALAKKIGVSQPLLSELENDKYAGSIYTPQFAAATNVSAVWLATGRGQKFLADDTEPSDIAPPREIAVLGTVEGGENGWISDVKSSSQNEKILYYGNDTNAYSLRIRGDAMADRILSGDRIIAEPGITPEPGDIVLVTLKDGKRIIRKLLYIRDDEVGLAPFNREYKDMYLLAESIEEMHKVVQIIPR